jgi:hypothetical protein
VEDEVEVEVLKPRPPVTPGPSVGIVTDTVAGAAGVELGIVTDFVDLVDVVDVFANAGHKASTIPPSCTMASKVFELTCTFEQASDTLLATEFSPATQDAEHPSLKSETVQDGIWLSYVNRQVKGTRLEVMLWKFARDRAFAAGPAAIHIKIFLRRMSNIRVQGSQADSGDGISVRM